MGQEGLKTEGVEMPLCVNYTDFRPQTWRLHRCLSSPKNPLYARPCSGLWAHQGDSAVTLSVKHSSLFLFLLHHSSPYFFLECFPSTLMHTHKNVVFCFHLCLGELCISYVVTYHGYPGSHLNLSLWCLLNIYLLEYSQVPQFQLNKCLCPFHVCILKLHTLSQYILSVNGSLIHLTAQLAIQILTVG